MLKAKVKTTLGIKIVHKSELGVGHINISTESKYELGRLLHPSWRLPFTHPVYGDFQSLEGFRWYVATGCTIHSLKSKYGHEIATQGRSRKREKLPNELELLIEAFRMQIKQNVRLAEAMLEVKEKHEQGTALTYYSLYGNQARDLNTIGTPMIDIITTVLNDAA